jgi:hypothetical protein
MKTSLIICLIFMFACSKPPAVDMNHFVGIGQILAKETCTGDDLSEYWIIDLYHQANTFKDGDSLFLNGIQYTNVIKATISNPFSVRGIGQKVVFDFERKLPVQNTRSCSVSNPVTYQVKQVVIKRGEVGELRGG